MIIPEPMNRHLSASERRSRYPLFVQLGLIGALIVMIGLFSSDWRMPAGAPMLLEPPPPAEPLQPQPVVQPEHEPEQRSPRPPQPIHTGIDFIEDIEEIVIDDPWETLPRAHTPLPLPPPRPEPEYEETIVNWTPVMPELIGGIEELQRRVRYPELARQVGIQGTVMVRFVVDTEGRVSEPECLNDPGGGLCQAAIDGILAARFTPGRQGDRLVKVRMTLPVRFRLR